VNANFPCVAFSSAAGDPALAGGRPDCPHVGHRLFQAGVYHQFVTEDGLFRRMWFGRRETDGAVSMK